MNRGFPARPGGDKQKQAPHPRGVEGRMEGTEMKHWTEQYMQPAAQPAAAPAPQPAAAAAAAADVDWWKVGRSVFVLAVLAFLAFGWLMGTLQQSAGTDRLQTAWDGMTPIARQAMCDASITPAGENFYGPARGLASLAGGDVDQYDAQSFLLDTANCPL